MSILEIDCIGKSVLIFGDTHFPYNHERAIPFLKSIVDNHKPDEIVCTGDECDGHKLSFHDHDPDLPSASDELNLALDNIYRLKQFMPNMRLVDSNHGSLVYRRAKKHGVPVHYLRTLKEVYNAPGWSWHEELILNTKQGPIYVCHGKSSVYGKLCKELGMSAVQGHYHGKFEITWHRSVTSFRFNAFTGSLVDEKSLAMAYGKNHMPKPIHGCLFIDKNGVPHMIRLR